MSLVFGVGVYHRGEGGSFKGIHTKEYRNWCGMLERCYSEKLKVVRPTYENCVASENFKRFKFFSKWCNEQIGFKEDYFHLDKDLLYKGNKLYSEDTCVFIPTKINAALTTRKGCRGDLPIGVYKFQGKYRALCSVNGTPKHLGMFCDPEQAFLKYKAFKEDLMKQYAEEYRSKIDDRAYTALINYSVDICD